jgi:mannose-1-phosphate guanylyltransferase
MRISGDSESGGQWVIVLAGGEGQRMSRLTQHWLGYHRPKQYCTFVGSRSMLQHTFDRASNLVPEERIVTVIGNGHQRFLECHRRNGIPGKLMEQPENMDTAPGLIFPLSYVAGMDPEATVVVFPSDHFIFPEARFLSYMRYATAVVEARSEQIVLMGAQADEPECDYGWMEPGPALPPLNGGKLQTRSIISFFEKPTAEQANKFYLKGFLWNTLIMVGKIRVFWELAKKLLPTQAGEFDLYHKFIQRNRGNDCADEERDVVQRIYSRLKPANFSRDILQREPERMLVIPMPDIDWNDWGRPCRVSESLSRLQKCPSFPVEMLAYA